MSTEYENRRVKMTKKLLRDALLAILEHKSIDQITIKELCEKADLNRSTFYLHYSCPLDVLKEMESQVISDSVERLEKVTPDLDSIDTIATFLEYIKENENVFSALLCQNGQDGFRKRFIAECLSHYADAIIFDMEDEKRQYVYQFLVNGSLAVLQSWIANDFRPDARSIAEMVYNLSDNAIKAYKA